MTDPPPDVKPQWGRLVADLARQHDITEAEAAERLRRALEGQVEPLRKFGP